MSDSEYFLNKRRDLIKRGEGCISHMYLDTVGKVTVAVGNMLPTADAATTLDFIDRETKTPASEVDIRKEFELVQAQIPAKVAASYKRYTKLDLTDEFIDQLLERRIDEFESGLVRDFSNYLSFPDEARLGLIDMAFNLGNKGLLSKFPSFTRAVRAKDWHICAAECKRSGISEQRNQETRELFEAIG